MLCVMLQKSNVGRVEPWTERRLCREGSFRVVSVLWCVSKNWPGGGWAPEDLVRDLTSEIMMLKRLLHYSGEDRWAEERPEEASSHGRLSNDLMLARCCSDYFTCSLFDPQSRSTLFIVTEMRILPPREANAHHMVRDGAEVGVRQLGSRILHTVPPLVINMPGGEVPELFCLICQNPEEKQGPSVLFAFWIWDTTGSPWLVAVSIKKPKTTAQEWV